MLTADSTSTAHGDGTATAQLTTDVISVSVRAFGTNNLLAI